MKTIKTIRSGLACAAVAMLATGGAAQAAESIALIYNGLATPNTAAPPAIPAFANWCAAAVAGCIPTVQQTVYDMASGVAKGTVYVWGAMPFNLGPVIPSALCFSEFMVFALDGGQLYTYTPPNGTCGATMDPVTKPPQHPELGTTSVIAGGGDGVIAGGTGRFQNWTGTFTDRVFVGFGPPTSGVGGIVYYDQLVFQINRK